MQYSAYIIKAPFPPPPFFISLHCIQCSFVYFLSPPRGVLWGYVPPPPLASWREVHPLRFEGTFPVCFFHPLMFTPNFPSHFSSFSSPLFSQSSPPLFIRQWSLSLSLSLSVYIIENWKLKCLVWSKNNVSHFVKHI